MRWHEPINSGFSTFVAEPTETKRSCCLEACFCPPVPVRFVDTRVMARIAVRVALPGRVLSRVAGRSQVYLDEGAE